jgi:hypothetical protein
MGKIERENTNFAMSINLSGEISSDNELVNILQCHHVRVPTSEQAIAHNRILPREGTTEHT